MNKKVLAIIVTCCAIVLALGLAGCGGSTSGSTSPTSGSAASSSSDAQAEAKAALDEGLGYWFATGANGFDKEKARTAFKKAADGGIAESWYWLGDLAQTDTSADRWPQVIDYYQKAADNGCAKGWVGLGTLYATGYGVEKDPAKAKELFEKAIEAGEPLGYGGLGYLYEHGLGVQESGVKADELYQKQVSEATDDYVTRNEGRCNLSHLYRIGAEGITVNTDKAMDYAQQAADENYYGGWRKLGNLYSDNVFEGNGGHEYDYSLEFECYSKAADLGDKYNVACNYRDGKGGTVDYAKAIELYQWEADGNGRNASWAMGGLALFAIEGMGMEKDNNVAMDWCNKAIDAAGPGDDHAVAYAKELMDYITNNSYEE